MKNTSSLGIVMMLIAVFGWFALVKPQINNFNKNLQETKIRQTEYTSYDKRLQDLDKIKTSWAEVGGIVNKLTLAMPRLAQIPETLVMVESLANSAGVSLSNVTIGSPSGQEVPMTFTFSGDVNKLVDFLGRLNSNVRTVVIHSQTLASDESGNLSISVQGGMIYQGNKYGGTNGG